MRGVLIFILASMVATPIYAAKKFHCWTDENGNRQCSDRLPPSEVNYRRESYNSQGIKVETTSAAKTKEEIAREAELAKRRAEQKRLADEQRKADQVLLRTFRSEDDIKMARDGKLTSIDVRIATTRGNIRRQKKRLAEMQFSAANMERSGKKASKNLKDQIKSIRQQIQSDYQHIIEQEQQKQQIREKYAADLARFRVMKKISGMSNETASDKVNSNSLLDTLVVCKQGCDELWRKVEDFIRQHATTPMQLMGSNIIMTRLPEKDTEVSYAVSRIKKGDGVEELFLDVQCKETLGGIEYCKSPTVQSVRRGFSELKNAPPAM
jgi:chromosome segregation ATPase